MKNHEDYIRRCFHLALLGGKDTQSNPNVGACIVHNDRIIGEGFHEYYGGPHAEVNAIKSVPEKEMSLLPHSTLYVSLEPCCHVGKTPACTSLILNHKIPRVVISCNDPNPEVSGKGEKLLQQHGVEVISGILEVEGSRLIQRFKANLSKRPYIILKWAQTADGVLGLKSKRLLITDSISNVLVHKWRTEVDAIMVGPGTVLADNPRLTARLFPGNNPARITISHPLLNPNLNIFNSEAKTIIFTERENKKYENGECIVIQDSRDLLKMMELLYTRSIYSVMIEGGKNLLESFIRLNLWDEARILVSSDQLPKGMESTLLAPYIAYPYSKKLKPGKDTCYFCYQS